MATSVISIKFDGYEKTFSNINGIAEELSSMNEEILKAEKELSNADFGSDEWNKLSESIQQNTTLVNEFTQAIENSSDVSLSSLQKVIKANEDYTKTLEESQKVFDEEFSSAKITEFGAKASAALLGVADSVALLGDSSKSAEELQKSFQQTVVVTNALKDSAEVLGDAQKKLASLTNLVSVAFKNGTSFSAKFSTGLKALGTAAKGPLLIFTLIAGAVTALIATFGGLQDIIDSISDSVAGLTKAFKALLSGDFNFFKNLEEGKKASATIRETNKELDRLASRLSAASVKWAEYQAAADQALTVEERRKNLNKIDEEKIKGLNDEIKLLDILAQNTTDIVAKRELWAKTDSKLIEVHDLLSQGILRNKALTIEAIDNEINSIDIRNRSVIDGLKTQLEFASLDLDKRLEIIDKTTKAEQDSLTTKITRLEQLGNLNEAELNDLARLKDEKAKISEDSISQKREEIKKVGALLRAGIALENQLEIERSEKLLEFIDIRDKSGIDYFVEEAKRIENLKTIAIDAELKKLNSLKEKTVEEKQQIKSLENERANIVIATDESITAKKIENSNLYYENERTKIGLNNELRANLLEQNTLIAEQQIKLLDKQTERIKKQAESFGSIFRIGKTRQLLEDNIEKKYAAQLEQLKKVRDEQLEIINGEKIILLLRQQELQNLVDTNTATSEQKAELDNIQKKIDILTEKQNKVKLEFDIAGLDNADAEIEEKKAAFGELVDSVSGQVGKTAELAQQVLGLGGDIIGLQIEALDAELDKIEDKRKSIEDKLAILNEALEQTQQEISTINTLIEESEGSRRAFLQEGLEKETAQRDQIAEQIRAEEAAKLSLAQQEEIINQKKEAAQKRADALERISTAIAATATAIQAALAVAKAAGQTGAGAVVTVPLTVAAIAAGLGAVLSIVSATRKFKDGGELEGPSHDSGGIKGTGSFGNIEVEGGEMIVNKVATRNNRDLLRKINSEGRWKKFENGGELLKPHISQVNNLISSNSVTGGLNELNNQKVYLSFVDFKSAEKKFTKIEEGNRI